MVRIAEIRKAQGKFQKDVAIDLRIPRSTYSQYETGKRTPDNETLVKIANYFNVSTDYLLVNTDDPTPPDAKKEAPAVFEAAEALRIFAEGKKGGPLTQEELNRLDDFVDIFINSLKK